MKPISLACLSHARWACDLDGVLAVRPPLPAKPWGRMNGAERRAYRDATLEWYRIAEPLGRPDVPPEIILSARKDTPEVRAVTQAWLDENGYAGVPLRLLDKSRTTEHAAAFKHDAVLAHDCDALVEDNRAVLRAMARLGPVCWLYFWDGTGPDAPALAYHFVL